MRVLKALTLSFLLLFTTQSLAIANGAADRDQALKMFKKYINNMVQRVEKAKDPAEKRSIMNESFGNMITVFDKVKAMGIVSEADRKAVTSLKSNIVEKQNELRGLKGFKKVPDQKLNNFANFVQQDLEQAETVTITISVTLLVLVLALLLLL